MKQFTTREGHADRCQNLVCGAMVEPIKDGWRRTARVYCSDSCKLQAWMIRKVAGLFRGIPALSILEILKTAQVSETSLPKDRAKC